MVDVGDKVWCDPSFIDVIRNEILSKIAEDPIPFLLFLQQTKETQTLLEDSILLKSERDVKIIAESLEELGKTDPADYGSIDLADELISVLKEIASKAPPVIVGKENILVVESIHCTPCGVSIAFCKSVTGTTHPYPIDHLYLNDNQDYEYPIAMGDMVTCDKSYEKVCNNMMVSIVDQDPYRFMGFIRRTAQLKKVLEIALTRDSKTAELVSMNLIRLGVNENTQIIYGELCGVLEEIAGTYFEELPSGDENILKVMSIEVSQVGPLAICKTKDGEHKIYSYHYLRRSGNEDQDRGEPS